MARVSAAYTGHLPDQTSLVELGTSSLRLTSHRGGRGKGGQSEHRWLKDYNKISRSRRRMVAALRGLLGLPSSPREKGASAVRAATRWRKSACFGSSGGSWSGSARLSVVMLAIGTLSEASGSSSAPTAVEKTRRAGSYVLACEGGMDDSGGAVGCVPSQEAERNTSHVRTLSRAVDGSDV